MMKYGFFNAVQRSDGSYDREYDADFFTQLLSTAFYSAVPPDSFKVSAGTGLNLNISAGRGFVNGVFFYDNNASTLTCSSASGTRTDLVVARLNKSERTVSLTVKQNTTEAADNEVALANVTITGSSIKSVVNIEHTRIVRNVPRITYGTGDPPAGGHEGDIYIKLVK